MENKVLLIEIRDKEIALLLNSLREIFSNRNFSSGIHITIKGPQKTFRKKAIEQFTKKNEPIYINDVGIFENNDFYVVYLKIRCSAFNRHMWYKPDYKNEYNPHITIYKGKDKKLTYLIYEFLKSENISLVSANYNLVTHTLKQPDLFSTLSDTNNPNLSSLINNGIIRDDILFRAKNLVLQSKNGNTIRLVRTKATVSGL